MSFPTNIDLTNNTEISQISFEDCPGHSPNLLSPDGNALLEPEQLEDQGEQFTLYQTSQPEIDLGPTKLPPPPLKVNEGKLIVPNNLLTLEPMKQNANGIAVMRYILESAQRLGFDNCLANRKKGPFFKKLNEILHSQDGPLFNYKKTKDNSFQKKVSKSFKLLDDILIKPHSDADGVEGKEWPTHLHSLLHLYRSVKER